MINHIYLVWQAIPGKNPGQIRHSFMKFTPQQIKVDLVENHRAVLDTFWVNGKERTYQFWERNSLGIELYTDDVFLQKLEYNHWNPLKAALCSFPKEYCFSSSAFYHTGIDNFRMLTHC